MPEYPSRIYLRKVKGRGKVLWDMCLLRVTLLREMRGSICQSMYPLLLH